MATAPPRAQALPGAYMETDDSHGPATPPHECSEAPDGRERLRTRASARVTPPSPAHGRRRFMHPATQADIELGLTGTPTVFEPVRISGRPVSVRHHCQSACRIGSPRGKTSQRTHCSTAPPTARQRLLPRIWRVPGPRRIARPRDRFRLMVVRSRAICGRLRRSQRAGWARSGPGRSTTGSCSWTSMRSPSHRTGRNGGCTSYRRPGLLRP